MAYVNNGTERSLKVAVNKIVGGNQVQGYPKTYDGQVSWGNISYPTLTDDQFRQLSEGDFTARYNAFVAYVEAVENGVDFDTDITGDGAIRAGASCISTTTTTAAPESYSFAVKYGVTPVAACNGMIGLAYSDTPTPGVNTILYKDAALTQRWDLAAAVLFVSPALYGNEVAGVAIVDTDLYDVGEIMLLTGYICGSSTNVTTFPPTMCVAFSSLLGWGVSTTEACQMATSNPGQYYGDNANFTLSTRVSANPTCSPTLSGYYSNGYTWRYSPDGNTFTTSGLCTPVTTAAPTGFINWNLNDMSGVRISIRDSSGNILVNETSSDFDSKTGTISNASGTYTITLYRIIGSGFVGNIVRMRVCDGNGNTAYYTALAGGEPTATFTTLNIPSGSASYTIYATSGDLEPATCG